MLWYVIQTYTGKEEKVMGLIRHILPQNLYGECFVIYHEQLRCRNRENQVHIERIFPGYAFITSDEPEKLFFQLKHVPAMSKMMADGEFFFTPLEKEEARFLRGIMDRDHVIRLSYAATDGKGHVSYLSGPLEICGERVIGYQFRKRYAMVRLRLSGQEKEVRMGIILNDDIRRELAYGKVEAPLAVPERYTAVLIGERKTSGGNSAERPAGNGTEEDGERTVPGFRTGDVVIVIEGVFEGQLAIVEQVKKNTIKIHVRLFERDITAEVPAGSVRKTR